ncbi:MAG: hypothetical protein Q7K44_05215, partial [Candidatus Liptonbacteria bacterium]|nr:hypothetical protein [Candidatus Liptonbacteria bacterium]
VQRIKNLFPAVLPLKDKGAITRPFIVCPKLLKCSFRSQPIGERLLESRERLFLPKPSRPRHPFAGEAGVMKLNKVYTINTLNKSNKLPQKKTKQAELKICIAVFNEKSRCDDFF